MNYDATACYDRIIPNLAMLVSQKFGVHPLVTMMNAKILQAAKYKVRTEMGISESSYGHSSDNPVYGTGQGAGNSSNILWGSKSSVLYDAYDTVTIPATYMNPDKSNETNVSIIGFVDDNSGQANRLTEEQNLESLQWLVDRSKENASVWAGLLGATGGALELSKCSYHVVFWKFSKQGAPVLTNMSDEIPPIEVVDPHTNISHLMEYLSPYAAHKTLGHYKEPAGLQQEQYKRLLEKSDTSTEFLWKPR
jgi:hypothetical protein